MIRKLLLPLAALVLLAGCATGYTYRGGSGDYYHGAPRVEYRHYYPGYPYGYYGYGPYRYSPYSRYYGYPYRYRTYRYGYPYGHPYYRPHVRPRVDTTPDRPRSPWRDLDNLRNRDRDDSGSRVRVPRRPGSVQAPVQAPRPASPPAPRVRSGGDGSAIGGMLRRTRERRHENATP